jgi:hypothetical protein
MDHEKLIGWLTIHGTTIASHAIQKCTVSKNVVSLYSMFYRSQDSATWVLLTEAIEEYCKKYTISSPFEKN